MEIFLLFIGFVLLVKGADFFVDGASGIAKKLKVSTFIIGVTVVAFGTSAPELAVTITDALAGSGQLIVGNILGSNVINIFLILGLSAVIKNLPVEKTTRFIDLPFLILSSALFVIAFSHRHGRNLRAFGRVRQLFRLVGRAYPYRAVFCVYGLQYPARKKTVKNFP